MNQAYQFSDLPNLFSEHYMASSDDFAWVRNGDFQFSRVTNLAAKMAGYHSFEQMQGTTCYDLKCVAAKCAGEFDRQHTKVLVTKEPMSIIDLHAFTKQTITIQFSRLTPIVNDKQKTVGVLGKSQQYTEQQSIKLIECLFSFGMDMKYLSDISLTYELMKTYPNANLSVRESECFFYIMRGYSDAGIAANLNLSKRTIESYTNNIKLKLQIVKRHQLIEYAIAERLMYILPISLISGINNVTA